MKISLCQWPGKQNQQDHSWIIMILLLFIMGLIVPDALSSPIDANTTSQSKRFSILLINSYHSGYRWTDNITQQVERVLLDKLGYYEFHVEYLDGKRI